MRRRRLRTLRGTSRASCFEIANGSPANAANGLSSMPATSAFARNKQPDEWPSFSDGAPWTLPSRAPKSSERAFARRETIMTEKAKRDGHFGLAGQRVLVVGGTSGMGLGTVRMAAEAGAEVIAAGPKPPAAGVLPSTNGTRYAPVDMTNEASIVALFDEVGPLDHVLVSATPPTVSKPFLEQDVASAQQFMNGKFFGSWACARYAVPKMRAGGSITFVTGCISVRPAGSAMVTASFAALEALTPALAQELGPLRVNTLRPGVIDSAMWNFLDPSRRERFFQYVAETMPVRRVGAIKDIGHAAVFLMTNPYVTGAVLEISGGETLVNLKGPS